MGKEVIVAADGPGFLVNRCGRPFGGEGLRLLQERVATHEQIDRICRLGGGFRMGPFELMDLVGIDVGFEVAKSFDELSFGEPRWRPNPIQARMVAAGRLGRKTGRGYYEYAEDGTLPARRPRAARAGRRRRHARWRSSATARVADGLRERARPAGFELREGGPTELVLDARLRAAAVAARAARRWRVLCASSSLAARGEPGAVGFHLLPPLGSSSSSSPGSPRRQDFAADGGGGVLRPARLPRRVGRGRARARARPDRLPARQRGAPSRSARAWARRTTSTPGSTLGLSPPARAGRLERGDRARARAGRARRALGRAPRGALPRRPAAQARRGARA